MVLGEVCSFSVVVEGHSRISKMVCKNGMVGVGHNIVLNRVHGNNDRSPGSGVAVFLCFHKEHHQQKAPAIILFYLLIYFTLIKKYLYLSNQLLIKN